MKSRTRQHTPERKGGWYWKRRDKEWDKEGPNPLFGERPPKTGNATKTGLCQCQKKADLRYKKGDYKGEAPRDGAEPMVPTYIGKGDPCPYLTCFAIGGGNLGKKCLPKTTPQKEGRTWKKK